MRRNEMRPDQTKMGVNSVCYCTATLLFHTDLLNAFSDAILLWAFIFRLKTRFVFFVQNGLQFTRDLVKANTNDAIVIIRGFYPY